MKEVSSSPSTSQPYTEERGAVSSPPIGAETAGTYHRPIGRQLSEGESDRNLAEQYSVGGQERRCRASTPLDATTPDTAQRPPDRDAVADAAAQPMADSREQLIEQLESLGRHDATEIARETLRKVEARLGVRHVNMDELMAQAVERSARQRP